MARANRWAAEAITICALLAGCAGAGTTASAPGPGTTTPATATTAPAKTTLSAVPNAKQSPAAGRPVAKSATAGPGRPSPSPATRDASGTPGTDPRLTDRQTGRVVEVIDGDTFRVRVENETETVRVLGINTPEVSGPYRAAQCFGAEASTRAKELLDGQTVTIATDPTQDARDQFDRRLAHVWLSDGRLFAEVMTGAGYAGEYTPDRDNPHLYRDRLRQAQNAARQNERGLWSPATCDGRFDRAPGGR